MKTHILKLLGLMLLMLASGMAETNAAEQPVTLWQIDTQKTLSGSPSSNELHVPEHVNNLITLELEFQQFALLKPKSSVALSVPLYQQQLQLNVTNVKYQNQQTIVHATDGSQRMVLTTDGNNTFATVITERGVWSITGKGNTAMMYQTHNKRHNHTNIKDDFLIAPEQLPTKKKPSATQQMANDVNSDDVAVVDAYILYNDAVVQLYGATGALTRINHIVAVTNDIYQASNVKISLNALRIDKVDYPQIYDSEQALEHATGQGANQAFFAEERQIRDAIGADAMILFRPGVSDGTCGIAWVNSSFYSNTYMVSHSSIDCGDDTNAHELGHNMGLSHSRRQGSTGGTYPFALGYGVDGEFTTVMAYASSFAWGTDLYKFSSPDLDCKGQPCGIDRNDATNGADAVYALNQKRFDIAGIATRGPSSGSLNVLVSGVDSAVITSTSGQGGTAPYMINDVGLGSRVILSAPESASGVPFAAWVGCDTVTELQCDVVIRGDMQVTALFSAGAASFADAVDAPQLVFNSSGDSDWQIDFATSAQGVTSIRSGVLADSQQSSVETTINGAGTLRFSWKVSSEQGYDFLRLYVNGQRYTDISGEINWYEAEVTLQDGSHQIRWTYVKDGSVTSGADAGWLDNVSWDTAAGSRQLTLNKSGTGGGTVVTSPIVRVCDEECDGFVSLVDANSWLYLTATANSQSEFTGWTGACSGQGQECQLFVSADITTMAIFNYGIAPDNDNFASAAVISGGSGQTSGNNIYATAQDNDPQIAGSSGKTVWWRWTAPSSGIATFNTFNSNFNTALAVYTGSALNALTQLAFNDNAGANLNSQLSFRASAGVEYYVLIDGMSNGAGDIALQWDVLPDVDLELFLIGNGAGEVQLTGLSDCRNSSCNYTLSKGQQLTLTATAQTGSDFVGWSGACVGDQVCQLTLNQTMLVSASFALKQYTVSSSVSAGGEISNGAAVVLHGQQALFELLPEDGYKVVRKVGGTCPPGQWLNATTYQTGVATTDCSVSFTFIERKRRRLPFWLFALPQN